MLNCVHVHSYLFIGTNVRVLTSIIQTSRTVYEDLQYWVDIQDSESSWSKIEY